MQTSIIQQRLTAYGEWKTRVSRAVSELAIWLESEGQAEPESRERIRHAREVLDRDRLTIAFVAEPSRGKTELINAVFFSDYGRPFLPTDADQGTLCPTEVLWDQERNEAYLRLLPIESRARDLPIAQVKRDPLHWVQYPLRTQSPEQTTFILREILKTKKVSMAEATRLGLSGLQLRPAGKRSDGFVEIPKWRHAIVSFPHPLLEQGLIILDTPGFGAIGSGQDPSLHLLPTVHTVLFVLAADTGVTLSDLETWQRRLKGFQTEHRRGIVVALNKIDVLWDEGRESGDLEDSVGRQRAHAARSLGIHEASVFPVSARQALLARVQGDEAMLRRSTLPALEVYLSGKMLEAKHQALMDTLEADVGQILERNRARIGMRISEAKTQIRELEQLLDKSDEVIGQLLRRTREEQQLYLRGVQQFQVSRAELMSEVRLGREMLDRDRMAALVDGAYREMTRRWTTRGLSTAMKELFEELQRAMRAVCDACDRIREKMELTYRQFDEDFGIGIPPPTLFITAEFEAELGLLHQELEGLRASSSIALAEQGSIIKRFQRQIIHRALLLFDQLRVEFDVWSGDALQPLAEGIQEHQLMMEKRLDSLQRIGRSKGSLQTHIKDLQKQYVDLAHQLTALRNIDNALHYDPLLDEPRNGRPHLVTEASGG